jgi:peptidoglycan/xylan/chitin deacetylase (PgdA/CDA1 family)
VVDPVLQRLARGLHSRQSVILAYHGVGPTNTRLDPGFLRVRPQVFRSQVELLLQAGFEFVTVAELVDRAGGGTPPAGMAALTFDDGMDDNHSVVLAVLEELNLPATVYIATGLIGKPNPWMARDGGVRMMNENELCELARHGLEIGAHSVTHPDLSKLNYQNCLREMTDSRTFLEELTGTQVRTFAYPFCRYALPALSAVKTAGFSAAVTCQGLGSWDPYVMKRSLITGKDSLPTFLLKLTDHYQPLFESLPSRFARAGTRGLRERRRERVQARRERASG